MDEMSLTRGVAAKVSAALPPNDVYTERSDAAA